MKKREAKRNKTQEKQVLHTTIAHHPLINAKPVLKLQLASLQGNSSIL